MKFVFSITFVVLVAGVAFGQGSLNGTVVDDRNVPLPNVNVYLTHVGRGAISDAFGRFVLRNIDPGAHEVSISLVGYQSYIQTVTVQDGQAVQLNVTLKPGELVLADVVVTDRFNTGVNTISQVDIKLRPINTSQDILRLVPGLFIAQHAGGGKAEQIFLRGFDIDHGTDINLEVDGLPVNMVSHAHGQGYSDLHFLIPELVETVDFDKGPYFAEKGNFTTAGYAAFHTKNNLDQNMVKIEGGRFGMLRNVNAITLVNKEEGNRRSNAYVASEYFRTDGFFRANQHFNRLNMMARYNAYREGREAFTINLSTFSSRWDASGQIPERAVSNGTISRFGAIDPTEGGETSRTNASVKYLAIRDNGGVFENQFYFSKYDFNLVSNFTFFLNDPVDGDQITQDESRNIYGYKGSYSVEHDLGRLSLHSEVGGGFRYDDVNDIHLYRTKSRKLFLSDVVRGDIDETNLYAFLNETLFVGPRFSLNAALRMDHFTFNYVDALTQDYIRQSVSKVVASPKLNLSYAVSAKMSFFIRSGIGFHSNDTRVVVAQGGEDVLPRAYSLDAGANLKIAEKLLLNTALWTLNLDQEFVYVGDEGIVEPGGKTQRKGIDISLRYQPLRWLYFDGDVNITEPRAKGVPEGEHHIPLAPTFTSIGGASCKFANGLDASVRYRYLGDRPANESNSVVADGYLLLDAVLKYTRKSFEVSVSAENLLNEEWKEAQFDTESRLVYEADPVSEIHFTPGIPFFLKTSVSFFF